MCAADTDVLRLQTTHKCMHRVIQTLATGAMLVGMLVAPSARADRTIESALFVSKSENKNQVHYGVHIDDTCTFAGSSPVYAYWRMLEKGPASIEPLLAREQRAYGIARQDVHGDTVRVTLRALPSRPITVRVMRTMDGTCVASAEMTIAGRSARLFNVHVALGFLSVDHLLLTGWTDPDGHVVRERINP